jgi:23S rRNA (uracil1939-C5)-methyltransferase
VLNEDSSNYSNQAELIKEYAQISKVKNIIIAKVNLNNDISTSGEYVVVKGDPTLVEIISDNKLTYHTQGFFQNNSAMAEKMVNYVHDKIFTHESNPEINISPKDSILVDLYGGVGTFGITNADLFKECHIIEIVKESTDCAKQNIIINDLKKTFVTCGDASTVKRFIGEKRKENIYLITDPPRSGMDEKTIRFILELLPKSIFYISCNPEEMAKELRRFKKDYIIKSISIFDLFPQTNHIEAIAELRRIN